MGTYLLRRIGQLLLTLLGGFTLLFLLFFALPGDTAELIAGGNGRTPPPSVVENVRIKYHLNDPLYQQYARSLWETVTLSGESFQTKERVSSTVAERLPNSLRLAFWALLIEISVGVSSGILSARRRNSIADAVTTTAAVVAGAIPVFVLAFLLKQLTGVYAFQHNWPDWLRFPPLGIGPDEWILGIIPSTNEFEYVLQPAFVLASVSTAIIARLTRTSMLEAATAEHVRTARSKGLKEGVVQRKHVLRNALIPVVTYLGVDFGTLVGFAVLTETVFDWPGLGSRVARAAGKHDLPVVLALSVVVMAIYGIASLAVDMSYAFLDPRIRSEVKKS